MQRANVLFIMTDEERYPPAYESDSLREFRKTHLPARAHLSDRGVEFERHYAASCACMPSRTSVFTGQYPSLHGVTSTDGMAKAAFEPDTFMLEPDTVPTAGHWFRAAGYDTYYKGKWHISQPDLRIPGSHEGLASSDDSGRPIPDVLKLYLRTDRLDPYGFTGWIGREPHGPNTADLGLYRDPLIADQVCGQFDALEADTSGNPWFMVASFVNPHDIFASGLAWEFWGLDKPDASIPDEPPAPSEDDSFAGRPTAHARYVETLPKMLLPQEHDLAYRRFYYWLHQLVDREIARVVERFEASRFVDDTIVVFTSDHGDLLGSHGGMMQKWYNAYDEAIRVPFVVHGPDIGAVSDRVSVPTSHSDVLPTLLGLARVDTEAAAAVLADTHVERHDLPGRDLSGLLTGAQTQADVAAPVYFMTEDQMSRGFRQNNRLTRERYEAVPEPANIESVIVWLPDDSGNARLWKLNHYYERLAEWERAHGVEVAIGAVPPAELPAEPAESEWELYDLTDDPFERANAIGRVDAATRITLERRLEDARERFRKLPRNRNQNLTSARASS